MISWPYTEVDEPKDAEDEPDPDSHERVDRAQGDRVNECLDVLGHDLPKYASTMRRVSPASCGPRVNRSSPLEMT